MKNAPHYGWEWSSHQPLLQAIISIHKPIQIVELGLGMFSTPILVKPQKYEFKYLGIDTDEEWIGEIKKTVVGGNNIVLRHQQLPNEVVWETLPKNLTETQRKEIEEYYSKLFIELSLVKTSPNFLFVDNHSTCRTIAICKLINIFDVVAYHDCQEPAGIDWYSYYFPKEMFITHNQLILKTPTAWTGCFIKKELCKEKMLLLIDTIKETLKKYQKENNLSETGFEILVRG